MKITKELLERYACGLCSPEEVAAVEAWLASPESEVAFPPVFDVDRHKKAIWKGIEGQVFEEKAATLPVWSYNRFGRWLFAAAVILIGGLAFFVNNGNVLNKRKVGKATKFRLITTRRGEKSQVRLSDGSLVHLNAGSELRVPVVFKDSVRLVHLRGEAFVQVAKDVQHPFIVRTDKANVRVLGTQFNVQAYPDEKLTTVVVKEGRVRFSQRGEDRRSMELTDGERGVIKPGTTIDKDSVYSKRYFEWKDNNLVFDNQNMEEISRILQRWYGVDVKLGSGHVARQRYTGEFADKPVDYVVENLCYVMDLKYKITRKKILIY
jgi:transmembrane sensor